MSQLEKIIEKYNSVTNSKALQAKIFEVTGCYFSIKEIKQAQNALMGLSGGSPQIQSRPEAVQELSKSSVLEVVSRLKLEIGTRDAYLFAENLIRELNLIENDK